MADWKHAFEVVTHALGIIHDAASTPGIDLIPYVGTVAAAAGALQAGLNAGIKIAPYVVAIKDTFTGGLPTEAQRTALNAKIAELEALVGAPLPPKEEGEPE